VPVLPNDTHAKGTTVTIDYTYAKNTKVPVSRSRDEIEGVLSKLGADAIAFMREATMAQIAFRLGGRHYVLRLDRKEGRNAEQLEREQWRQMLLLLKAKLVAIQTGITTAEEEFLAHAMLPTGQTLGAHLIDHPDVLRTTGPLMLPGGSS
jgi:hypothetical protein